ncbi:LuxR C-terminal-related transcriptional regulator [Camelimonas sp. ID_303_24]
MLASHLDAIHILWDELSDFDANQSAAASDHLMAALSSLTNICNITWAGAVRLPSGERTRSDDVMRRWRVAATRSMHPYIPPPHRIYDRPETDISMDIPLRDLGRFRHYTFRHELPADWFSSPFFQAHYGAFGIQDATFVAFPVNQDCESHFGFWSGQPMESADIALVSYALRGIKWFHRRLMLSHGLLLASAPLTPTEQKVLQLLLTAATEKWIAHQCGMAVSTTHQHISAIYRKFGVRSRAGLMSLWLNRGNGD